MNNELILSSCTSHWSVISDLRRGGSDRRWEIIVERSIADLL